MKLPWLGARPARDRGNRARDARRWFAAVAAYREHLDDHPDDVAILVQLGHVLRELGDPAAAEVAYARAERLTPRDADLLLCWGHLRKSVGDIDGARDLYRRSADIDGNEHAVRERDALAPATDPVEPDPVETAPSPVDPAPPVAAAPSDAPAWATDLAIAKPFAGPAGAETVLFVTRARDGILPAHATAFIDAVIDAGLHVLPIVLTDRIMALPPTLLDRVSGAVVRRSDGGRFAAWAHVLKLYPELYGSSALYLASDAVVGDYSDDRFVRLLARIRAGSAELTALTQTPGDDWHVDCDLIRLSPALLSAAPVQAFFESVKLGDARADGLSAEIAFSTLVRHNGHRIDVLFPNADLRTPDGWHAASAAGLPFAPAAAQNDRGTPTEGPLLAGPPHPAARDATRTVALFAPVNYAGPDGDRARALLCTLRRLDVRLNVYPIRRDYHGAVPIAPPADVIDYETPTDIAIVQLDPDDWDLLNDHQQGLIAGAQRRIGYWTAACDDRLVSRVQDYHRLDRIWTPDGHAAERLDRQDGAPVEALPGPDAMLDSMDATVRDSRAGRRVHRPLPSLARGRELQTGDRPHASLRVVLLAPDGAPLDDALPGTDDDGWILFAPAGTVVDPDLGDIVAAQIAERPDAALFYADDIAVETDFAVDHIRLKPEYDGTLLAAQDYVGAPVIVAARALAQLGGLSVRLRTAALSDLLFRAHAAGLSIARIPHVLLGHRGRRVASTQADHIAMLRAQPAFGSFDIVPVAADRVAVRRRFAPSNTPNVTIVIPTMRAPLPGGKGGFIERLLIGIADVDWPMDRLTVLVGDDGAGTPDWAERDWPFDLVRIDTARAPGEPFNYAAKMNTLWRAARDEQIVLMNDDLLPTGRDWLKGLQTFAVDPGVGGVGARLLFPDGRLQHAGLARHGTGAAHVWVERRHLIGAYQGWADVQREWSMVTGALFATRRSLLEQVGGFDERFSLEYNDVDLCLRLRSLGYRIVCTPLAEMIHSEKASRGADLPPGDQTAWFRARWRQWLVQDPSWHPRMHDDLVDMTPQYDGSAWYA